MIPLRYSVRNVWVRRVTTGITVGGLGCVVFVFVAVLMLAHGLETALVTTGHPDNAIVLRKGATSEIQSRIDRQSANIITAYADNALGANAEPMVATEMVVLINLRKRSNQSPGQIVLRGISAFSRPLRPQITLLEGRMTEPDTFELLVGKGIAGRFTGAGLGETLQFGRRAWSVVGVFGADGSAFESEIWGDREQLMAAFGRPAFSSMTARLASPVAFETLHTSLEADPRLQVYVQREMKFYAAKSGTMTTFIRVLGLAITIIFSIGAVIGATITLYSTVARRTGEVAILRTIGFSRLQILGAFLTESLVMGLAGGLAGIGGASLLQFVSLSTMVRGTFSEFVFGFTLSPPIAAYGLLFGVGMGIVGGFFPAIRASRIPIVNALANRGT